MQISVKALRIAGCSAIEPMELYTITVLETIKEGETVYRAD